MPADPLSSAPLKTAFDLQTSPLAEDPPDIAEQEAADDIDNVVPTRCYQMTRLVGLGGSAGSIASLQEFFQHMPPDLGLVFVVILHLSPEHESLLPEVLQRATSMKVQAAADGCKVEPNHVYVIPPGKFLTSIDGKLRLTSLNVERGKRAAVDLFFRTLADTHGPHATAVVLSGADGDGAIGIKRIKERGGLTIAQDPLEAEFPGMPRSAIGTGMVDWVLKVRDMPGEIAGYIEREKHMRLPPEEGFQPAKSVPASHDKQEQDLRDVLSYLRSCTGRDFSYYKRATILRRIARRMQVNGTLDLAEYLAYMRTHPGEAGALLQDLLISVTNFFRDQECFDALAARIPELFKDKTSSDSIRIWVAACATGEEAYSIAILLYEYAKSLPSPPTVQVFATDLDAEAIKTCRNGFYLDAIAADVPETWLAKFFVKEPHGYRVKREIREMILFAVHDVLRDSPFCRLDLVSCRNLLIYLTKDAQSRVIEIFHFALRPEGKLFLGSCEATEEDGSDFEVLDKKHRLYAKRASGTVTSVPLGIARPPLGYLKMAAATHAHHLAIPGVPGHPHAPASFLLPKREDGDSRLISWSEVHYKLLERLSPPSVLINQDYDIVHLSENVGKFLQLSGGEPTRSLLRAIHPMLRIELRACLYRATESGEQTDIFDLPFEFEGAAKSLDIHVSPATEIDAGFLVVVFQMHDKRVSDSMSPEARGEPEPLARQLERELESVKSYVKGVVEQYEVSAEELKASNEELQAMNEELRSATEELETSREELQSINEELTTVNHELKSNVEELGHTNADLRNLIGATEIATIFLDRQLCITRYTPPAVPLFNLIPSDVGRPLLDLKHRLHYTELEQDACRVIETLRPSQREVSDVGQNWYIARMLPYRTSDDRIAGVVLTFLDITERKTAEKLLRASEERLRLVLESAHEHAIFAMDMDRVVTSWNSGAERMLGYREQEIVGTSADVIFAEEDRREGHPEQELVKAQGEGRSFEERWYVRKDGTKFWASGGLTAMRSSEGEIVGFVKIFRDQTDSLNTRRSLEESKKDAEAASMAKDRFLAVLSHELRTPLTPISLSVMLLADEPTLSPSGKEAIRLIERNVEMECRLIDDLLDVTHIVRGTLKVESAPLDIHEVIDCAIEFSEEDIKAKGQKLSFTGEAANHGLKGDSQRLQQVFWNLLKNASKFTPMGGEISVRTYNQQRSVVVEVADNGVGISPAALPGIFESFAQGDPSTSKQFGGLGLGLAIAKATVEAHQGSIEARSEGVGRGATFTVTLPVA